MDFSGNSPLYFSSVSVILSWIKSSCFMPSLRFNLVLIYWAYLKQLHILTALSDSTSRGQIPVLPVHVVSSATRIIAQPNTKIFHSQRGLLIHLELHKSTKVVRDSTSLAFYKFKKKYFRALMKPLWGVLMSKPTMCSFPTST